MSNFLNLYSVNTIRNFSKIVFAQRFLIGVESTIVSSGTFKLPTG